MAAVNEKENIVQQHVTGLQVDAGSWNKRSDAETMNAIK